MHREGAVSANTTTNPNTIPEWRCAPYLAAGEQRDVGTSTGTLVPKAVCPTTGLDRERPLQLCAEEAAFRALLPSALCAPRCLEQPFGTSCHIGAVCSKCLVSALAVR